MNKIVLKTNSFLKILNLLLVLFLFLFLSSCSETLQPLDEQPDFEYPNITPVEYIKLKAVSPIEDKYILSDTTLLNNHGFIFYVIPDKNDFDLFISNKNPFQVSIFLKDSTINMQADVEMPVVAILDLNTTYFITHYSILDTATAYKKVEWPEFGYCYGSLAANHNNSYCYTLPYAKNESHVIGQGYNSSFTHNGYGAFSLDFLMPIGTKLYAARDGIVAQVVEKFTEHGIDDYFLDKTNGIIIAHDDGTIADYGHIRYNGAAVEKGQYVKKGQFIGFSGEVGYTNIPHLHFSVMVPISPFPGDQYQSVPTFFTTKEGNKIYLKEGYSYTSITNIIE